MYLKRILHFLSIGVIIGFIVGLIHSIFFIIIPNMYFQNKMYRLLISSLQKNLNKWVILSLIVLILLLIFVVFIRYILKSLFTKVLQVQIENKNLLIFPMFGIVISFILLYFGGSIINQRWLPERFNSISLFGNYCILIFVIFLGWIFTKVTEKFLKRVNWNIKFPSSIARYTKITALVFILFLILINVYETINCMINNPKGPNIILISIDTLRADHLGCYGYSRNTSPHLDSFAKQNIIFKNCSVQEDWTLTSHMSILTSLYPPTHRVNKNRSLDPKIITLTEILKNEGYQTLGFARCPLMESKYGFNQGFDTYIVKNYYPAKPELNAEFQNKFVSGYLQKYKKKKMFLFIHYYDVHSDTKKLPYDSPESYQNMFYPEYCGDFDGGFGNIYATRYLSHVNYYHIMINEEDLKYIVSLYDCGIAYMDKCIDDLFNLLQNLGLYDNSLIILTADHGEEFQEHGSMMHNSNLFYEESMRVPLIIKLPEKNNTHKELSHLIESIDIMPSILDYLNIEKKPMMQGKSFLRLIKNNDNERGKNPIFAFGANGNAFIRTEEWKLCTSNYLMKDEFMLFNLAEDPKEMHNVIKKYPKIAKSLKNKLFKKESEIQAHFIEKKVILNKEEQEKLKALGYIK